MTRITLKEDLIGYNYQTSIIVGGRQRLLTPLRM